MQTTDASPKPGAGTCAPDSDRIKPPSGGSLWRGVLLAAALAAVTSCETVDPPPPAPPPCEQACQDAVAMRAVREMCKLMFNLTLQGKPVGPQDQSVPCPKGGTARVFGEASSNASQGSTEVDLTYEFNGCGYLQKDDTAAENYDLTLTGSISQKGTLSAQSGSTSAILMKSNRMSFAGKVHDPAIDYNEKDCLLEMTQNGNHLSGQICGRLAGLDL